MTSRPSPAKPSRQAQPPASRSRRALLFLGLTCLLALLLRLWVCAELADTPAVQHPSAVTDMETYRRLALGVLHGEWPRVFDYQPFYYTLFLPFAYLFSPDGSPWPPMILQALVGTAACLLTGLAAERLYGRKAGCLAALFLALSRLHLFYTPFLLLEVCQGHQRHRSHHDNLRFGDGTLQEGLRVAGFAQVHGKGHLRTQAERGKMKFRLAAQFVAGGFQSVFG